MSKMIMIAMDDKKTMFQITLTTDVLKNLQQEIEKQYDEFTICRGMPCQQKDFMTSADIKLHTDEIYMINAIDNQRDSYSILNTLHDVLPKINNLSHLSKDDYPNLKLLAYIFYEETTVIHICLQNVDKRNVLSHRFSLMEHASVKNQFQSFQDPLLLIPLALTAYFKNNNNMYDIYFRSYFLLRNMIKEMGEFYREAQESEIHMFESNSNLSIPSGHTLKDLANSQRLRRKIAQIIDSKRLDGVNDHRPIHSSIKNILPNLAINKDLHIIVPTIKEDFEKFVYSLCDQCNTSLFSSDILLYEGSHPA